MPEEANGDDGDRGRAVRPFWSGTITFGLVSVPVNLFAAYRSARPSLRMVDHDGTPLERRYYCPRHERELSRDEIVRGYEVDEGRFVVVRDDELEALEPRKSKEIDLQRFVDRDQLEAIYFQRAYFLTPAGETTKPYRLLARTMEEAGRAGIATFVMRGREYLVAILSDRGILRAETMRFHDEIRSPEQIGLPDLTDPPDEEVDRIRGAVDALAAEELDPDELSASWGRRLEELVEAKRREDADVVGPSEHEEEAGERRGSAGADVIDIMEVLKRNLRGEGGGEPPDDASPDGRPSREELHERTRSELYDRAKELDIPGRSGMNKDDLVEAIRRAS